MGYLKTDQIQLSNSPWIYDNVVKIGQHDYLKQTYPKLLLKRLYINSMTKNELKNNDLFVDHIRSVEKVPPGAKIVITTDLSTKHIYPNQYYFQELPINTLDIEVMPSLDESSNSVNLVVSGQTISNLQYYEETLTVKYNLYMYHMHSIESEDQFSEFWSDNERNIMKYTNIHLLELSSYYLVKYLCNTTNTKKKNINLYVYDENDIKILSKIFENNIIIGSNVTIILYIGWISSSSQRLFLNYMNLILKMTEYKMRNIRNIPNKKINIDSTKMNISNISNETYLKCVQVLLNDYITKKKVKSTDYSACLSAMQNLETFTKIIDNTNDRITIMNNEYAGKLRSIHTTYTQLKTEIELLDELKTELKTDIEFLYEDIDDLDDKYDDIDEETKDIYTELKLNIDVLDDDIDNLEDMYDKDKKQIKNIQTQIKDIPTYINDIKTQIDDIKTQINGIKTQINGIKTHMYDKDKKQIKNIQTQIKDIPTYINDIKTQIDDIKTQINGIKTQINLSKKIDTTEQTTEQTTEHITNNYALKTYVDEKENDIYNTIDLQYETLSGSLKQLSQEFNRMKMDSENKTKSVNALYVLIVTFVIFFIILINIRTTKKKK